MALGIMGVEEKEEFFSGKEFECHKINESHLFCALNVEESTLSWTL